MNSIDDPLAAIGFPAGPRRPERVWRVERPGPVHDHPRAPGSGSPELGDFTLWLGALRDRPEPAIYRVRRAE